MSGQGREQDRSRWTGLSRLGASFIEGDQIQGEHHILVWFLQRMPMASAFRMPAACSLVTALEADSLKIRFLSRTRLSWASEVPGSAKPRTPALRGCSQSLIQGVARLGNVLPEIDTMPFKNETLYICKTTSQGWWVDSSLQGYLATKTAPPP